MKCPYCGSTEIQKQIQGPHDEKRPFVCLRCGTRFAKGAEMKNQTTKDRIKELKSMLRTYNTSNRDHEASKNAILKELTDLYKKEGEDNIGG